MRHLFFTTEDVFNHGNALLLPLKVVLVGGRLLNGLSVVKIAQQCLVLILLVLCRCTMLCLLHIQLAATSTISKVTYVDALLVVVLESGRIIDVATVSTTRLAAHIQARVIAREVAGAALAARSVRVI